MPSGLKEVNIKEDMPTAGEAIRRVTFHIHNSRAQGCTALKLIHGYGSTGKGGKIRQEVRRYLAQQKEKRVIRDFIAGEDFSIFNEPSRQAFALCPDLRKDSDLERSNNGVTIIVF